MHYLLPYSWVFGMLLYAASPSALFAQAEAPAAGTKRALIIAISQYPASSGYYTLHAHNDVPLIRTALEAQGFEPAAIRVLQDVAARRDSILHALDQLIEEAEPGDVVVVHYSGHGDQLPDDNGDELDGYDEVIVPVEARADKLERQAFIRDDTLNDYVRRLRRAVGADGNVTFWTDACYSGTVTRGTRGPRQRSAPQPLDPPAATRLDGQPADRGGVFERIITEPAGDGLAPFAAFSAARHDEQIHEVHADDGRFVGPLSLAMHRALAGLRPGATYAALFDHVTVEMAALEPSISPQLEGDADAEVFGGRIVEQVPYLRVREVPADTLVLLDGGSLTGLAEGARVAFYPIGTVKPATATAAPLATGTVNAVDIALAAVVLDAPAPDAHLVESWAFVTAHSFGDLRVTVHLGESLDAATRDTLARALAALPVVDLRDEQAALFLDAAPGDAVTLTTADGTLIGAPLSTGAHLADSVAVRLLDFARNQYLKRIDLSDDAIDVRLELIPATHRFDAFGRCAASDTTQHNAIRDAGYWTLLAGDGYLLRLHNTGTAPAYVAVLDLMPDGAIQQLFPLPYLSRAEAYLKRGQSLLIEDLCYVAAPPYGNEVLKVFATSAPIDFRPILTTRGLARSQVQGTGPLQRLLAEVHSGTRSEIHPVPAGAGSTHAIKLRVVPRPQ